MPGRRFLPRTPARARRAFERLVTAGAGARAASDAFVFTGLASASEPAGLVKVLRRSRTRPIMRRQVRETEDSGMVRAR